MLSTSFILLIAISLASFILGRYRIVRLAAQANAAAHSLPSYHGSFVALWIGVPCLLFVLVWAALEPVILDAALLASLPPEQLQGLLQGEENLLLAEIRSVSRGLVFGEPDPFVVEAAARLNAWKAVASWSMLAASLGLAAAILFVSYRRIALHFRARQAVERILSGLMVTCSVLAILVTLGIVSSLLFEAFRFFERVPVSEFLFGLNWEPQIPIRADQVAGSGAFGAIPVFMGTLLIAAIAMLVATPIGLFAAIYLAEYANSRLRAIVKPIMEILAGIPTVVYGFFAVLVVAPALREAGSSLGLDVAPNSALAAGSVMGIMILPFISSLSDDALAAVPRSLREGSYAMGATKAETIRNVLLPAALPGIVGGVLLAVSRAIGETMIVVMAAGLIATLTVNPADSVTTVTVQIVTLLIGDTEFDNPKTLAAFALGLLLFVITLFLNVLALKIVQKYREKYD